MKKKVAILLLFILLFGNVAACGGSNVPEVVTIKFDTKSIAVATDETVLLTPAVTGVSAKKIEWVSANKMIATVDGGRVKGISRGVVSIIARLGTATAVCDVTVTGTDYSHTELTREFLIKETAHALLSRGKSNYTIVFPSETDDELITETAVEELQLFFEEATGVKLPVTSDKNEVYSADKEYLSIGQTTLAEAAGITADTGALGQNGYRVATKGKSVFMVGGGRFGTLYAVYEFLAQQFGMVVYAVDEIKINKNVFELKLLDFNITDFPDFDWRLGSFGEYWLGSSFPKRMRMHKTDDIWLELGGGLWHNYMATIPPSIHKSAHPNWFSPDGLQLCLSRDVEGLSNEVVKQIKLCVEENPKLSNITFTQEDLDVWCSCGECTKLVLKYGTHAASNILFINVVAKKVKAWLDETNPDKELNIVIFAYHQVENAPAKLNTQTNEYEPIDENMVLDNNVVVMYAPIFAEHYYDFYSSRNTKLADTMKMWKALTDRIYLWSYSTYFVNYLMPYDSVKSMKSKYIFAYENGVNYMFDQSQYNQPVGTDWYRLKEYLSARLAWNVNADVDELTDEFFENYFKDAAPAMRVFYDSYGVWYEYLAENEGIGGGIWDNLHDKRLWPKPVLNDWMEFIEVAYESIAHLESSDFALYNKLKDRINLESLSLRHIIIFLYRDTFSTKDFDEFYNQFKYDCAQLGVTLYNEWTPLGQYFP